MRGRGVIVGLDKHEEPQYAWGLGTTTNNHAELLALWQGLQLLREKGIKKMVVYGDSMLVI